MRWIASLFGCRNSVSLAATSFSFPDRIRTQPYYAFASVASLWRRALAKLAVLARHARNENSIIEAGSAEFTVFELRGS